MLTEIYTFLQMMSLSEMPCIFQQDNLTPHTSSTRTAWLHNRRVWLLNFPACSPDLSLCENIWSIKKAKIEQEEPELLRARILYQTQWENCALPEVELKVEWILHSGKHGPIPTFWDVSLPSKLGRRSSRTPSIISLGARPGSGMHTSMQAVETTETMWHPFIHNTLCSPYLYRYAAWFYFFQCSFNLSEQCVYSVMPHIILC